MYFFRRRFDRCDVSKTHSVSEKDRRPVVVDDKQADIANGGTKLLHLEQSLNQSDNG